MQITQDRSIFAMELEALKAQPIWSVRRSSAQYYMGSAAYVLGIVSFRLTEDAPWSHYYINATDTLPGTRLASWQPLPLGMLYDNILIEHVPYAEAQRALEEQV